MPYLRFTLKLQDNFDNWIVVHAPQHEHKTFPFAEGEIVIMPLQFSLIEPGSFVHDAIKNALWTGELFPYGEYFDDLAYWRCQVKQATGSRLYSLYADVDRDNYLVTHITAADGTTFPFEPNDKVVMELQVKKIYHPKDTTTPWIASLGPVGQVVEGEAICEVKPFSE
jgi:hypothetical protein